MTSRLILAAVLLLSALSCQKDDSGSPTQPGTSTDPVAAAARVALAYSEMENQFSFWVNAQFRNANDFDRLSFSAANALYKEALALDPNNPEAHFGAAITEMLTAYADTQINNAVKRWETYLNTHDPFAPGLSNSGFPTSIWNAAPPLVNAAASVLSIQKAALQDPPLISEMQQLLRDRLLPRVDYGLQHLAVVERDTAFRFRISGRMQGDPDLQPVYMYITEILLVDAAWSGIKFAIEELLMYQFPLANYNQQTLVHALQQSNTSFFVLAPDGPVHAQRAKAALQNIIQRGQAAIRFLESFSGSRNDAVVKIGGDGFRQREIDSVKHYLQLALSSLSAPVEVFLRDADMDGNDYTILVHVGRYFDNPVANPKAAFLPSYSVDTTGGNGIMLRFTAQTYEEFTFPDPTFGGVFPGMSQETLKKLLQIDRTYAYDFAGSVDGANGYVPNATVTLYTATRTYQKVTNAWGWFQFYITDVHNVPYTVSVNDGSGDIELLSNQPLVIRAKAHQWANIAIPARPQGLVATRQTNPLGVRLSWQGTNWWSQFYYVVQRGDGAGSTPVDRDSSQYFNGTHVDYSVVAGQTYTYRIRTGAVDYWYWYGIYLYPRTPFYSNEYTIVP